MSPVLQPLKKIKPCNVVVFGGSGDLALRKIYPAFYLRFVDGQLNVDFNLFAILRNDVSREDFAESMLTFFKLNKIDVVTEQFESFLEHFHVLHVPENNKQHYQNLKEYLDRTPTYQTVYYLSTPSSAFGEICDSLRAAALINSKSKVVLEKPLGHDLASFKKINNTVSRAFSESQIYRIDHYLGKETVQNLMVLRFANHLFEHSWSSEDIESVQITVAESLGVENRGDYYDHSGALLDMVQNHLLQLLCLIAMEPPSKLEADQVRNEKLKVLNCLRMFDEDSVLNGTVRGQYSRGLVQEKEVSSYLEDIKKYESNTETFVAIKAHVDNWRWKNTPFFLRTGKRMTKRYSEIVINFKSVRHNVFPLQGDIPGNKLIIRLQPEERIALVQMTKIPGPGGYRYKPISLKLDYLDSFNERLPDAYERLMIDILRGEQTLFMRHDELEAAWIWIESIKDAWKKVNQKNELYEAGTWGPGDKILEPGQTWSTSL